MTKLLTVLLFAALAHAAFADDLVQIKGGLLTDPKGMSLYVFDADAPGVSNCNGGCATIWPPLSVTAEAKVNAPFSKLTRKDGSLQLASEGRPLYFYADDENPGDTNGKDIPRWHLAKAATFGKADAGAKAGSQVAIHCASSDPSEKTAEIYFIADRAVGFLGPAVSGRVQVNQNGRRFFFENVSVKLFPDSEHTINVESLARAANLILTGAIVKIDPGNPRFGATLEARIKEGTETTKIKEDVSCRLL